MKGYLNIIKQAVESLFKLVIRKNNGTNKKNQRTIK